MLRFPILPALVAILLLPVPCLAATEGSSTAPAQQQVEQEISARIEALIKQLGHKNYAARERAQAELVRFGLAAFDLLLDAEDDNDVEVALRARYLIHSMQIAWTREGDSPEVKSALRGYEKKNDNQRQASIERLASLSDFEGLDGLSRIVRFETKEALSKWAALMVIREEPPTDPIPRAALAKRIKQSVGGSRRRGGQWLQVYAQTLNDPQSAVEDWSRLARAEQEVFGLTPAKSSSEVVGALLLWQADMLRSLNRDDEAIAVLLRRLALLDDDRKPVLETVDWLIERQAWTYFDEFSRRLLPTYSTDAEFMYRLAEAREKQGMPDQAEQIARQAFEIQSDDAAEHERRGLVLQTRGLFEWAEREYRHVMKTAAAGTDAHINAHLRISMMLHDIGRDLAAAESLKQFIDQAEADPAVMQQILQRRHSMNDSKSRMHYYYFRNLADQGKWEQAKPHLERAIESDPTDADVLIAMYRLPDQDQAWRERTVELIEAAADTYRQQLDELRQQVERSQNRLLEAASRPMATLNNQIAWLIANTEGDFDEALRRSHRSLELRPGMAGYLDTLGRCYYAKKDYQNAVKYQREAIRLDPFSGLMRKQLDLFEKVAAEHAAEKQEQPAAPPEE